MMTIVGRQKPGTGTAHGAWRRMAWRAGSVGLAGAIMLWAAIAAGQGENGAGAEDPVDEIQSLIDDIQQRVDSIERSTTGSDTALDLLNEQVEEAIAKLTSRLDENVALRGQTSGLTSELQNLSAEEANLQSELARVTEERDGTIDDLAQQIALLADELAAGTTARQTLEERISFLSEALENNQAERSQLNEALEATQSARAKAEANVAEQNNALEDLRREVVALLSLRDEMEQQIVSLTGTLETGRGALTQESERANEFKTALERAQAALAATRKRAQDTAEDLRLSREELLDERSRALARSERLTASLGELSEANDRASELEALLAAEKERSGEAAVLQERKLAALSKQAEAAGNSLEEQRVAAVSARNKVSILSQQLAELTRQLQALNKFLEVSETKNAEQQAQIVDLGSRLNQALATRVQELANYRSEFFGRLREVLGSRSDVRVVGDRFVFQSEVLFASGEATLGDDGRRQLQRLAATLTEIAATIPPELNWVLRVDGHTDERPISTPEFPSNWELSTARALSVVKFLIDAGIEPNRLVAAGFGQYQPIDPRHDEIGYRRNRRIEFKLTER